MTNHFTPISNEIAIILAKLWASAITNKTPNIQETIANDDAMLAEANAQINRLIEREKLDLLYVVGNNFWPSGSSDGSPEAEWLEERINKLRSNYEQ